MIHVLDTLAAKPGQFSEVRRQVQERYQPLAAELDMHLAHLWMAPAVELLDRPTELVVLWQLADVPAFWRMRLQGARDERVVGFWEELAPLLEGHTRRIMCDPDDDSVLR